MKTTISPRELAEAIGVSESSLKRWSDEGLITVARTAGGHRRIPLSEAIRYIRKSGLRLTNPEALGLTDLTRLPDALRDHPEAVDQPLVDAVMQGRADLSRSLVLAMYVGGRSIPEICDGALTRAMHQVGELWRHDPDGIAIEHRASDICAQAVHQLRGLLPPLEDDAPVATGGAPSGDVYYLPSLMAATVLRAEGWRDENLAADVPVETMVDAARRFRAQIVWLSVSIEQPAEKIVPQVVDLARRLETLGTPLVAGGRALPGRATLCEIGNLHQLSSMSELAAFARGLRHTAAARRAGTALPSPRDGKSAIPSVLGTGAGAAQDDAVLPT